MYSISLRALPTGRYHTATASDPDLVALIAIAGRDHYPAETEIECESCFLSVEVSSEQTIEQLKVGLGPDAHNEFCGGAWPPLPCRRCVPDPAISASAAHWRAGPTPFTSVRGIWRK